MCTKYNLKDNPDIFKQFIPRNLSYTEFSNQPLESKFSWCLMTDDQYRCQCRFPKLSKMTSCRLSRKDLFTESVVKVQGKSAKDDNCWMCQGSLSYCPNDVTVFNLNYNRSKSINGRSSKSRKSVRFADALGLQLTEIKLIHDLHSDKAPCLTSSAIKDLHLDHNYHFAIQGINYFSPCFKIDESVLQEKALLNNICLEKAFIEGMDLLGSILVKNLSFEKNVGVRITFNNWKSFKDVYASYILQSSTGIIDKFSFSIALSRLVVVNSKIEFALFYLTQDGNTFWDNNDGKNYAFECFAKNMGLVTEDGWTNFL